MFGVNKTGQDTLAPQFRRGRKAPSKTDAAIEWNEGLRFSIESNMRWLRKVGLDEIRRKVLNTLKAAGDIMPKETDIETLVETALYEKSERLALEARDEQQRFASAAAILSVGGG